MRVPRCRAIAVAVVAGAVTSCSGSHAAGVAPVPPRAEFILSNADSSFWVATTSGEIRVRGVPLMLARYGKRFYELYTADDDRSYPDALFVGVRLYRRDILTGDSVIVFSDTSVVRVADVYARTHPDERPLAPDEEGDANPATSATAEVDILDVFGPFLSYEYHVDVELPHRAPWHTTLRGVLDLRTGKQTVVSDLIGEARARAILASAGRSYELVRDSLRALKALTAKERKAVEELERRRFDPRCFALESVNGQPAITFGVPGVGEGNAGNLVELEPIPVDSLDWWADVRPLLATADSSDNDRWKGTTYSVLARYDAAGQTARLSLLDSAKREWSLGAAGAPVRRVDWLDRPPPTDAERFALRRAFDQAANYDDNARVADASARGVGVMRFASASRFRHAPLRRSSERRAQIQPAIGPTRSVIR